jgi:putative hydroxymethylpyrimidine transporter CytX
MGGLGAVHLFFLWFGASVSVAEILTGGLLAGMGVGKGMAAIVLGHLLGTALLALAGVIGYRERLPAIKSTRISFGRRGSYLVSVVNVLQLVGWTAVMVLEGGRALDELCKALWGFQAPMATAGLLGLAIGLWVLLGVRGFRTLNVAAVMLLFALTVVLSVVLAGRVGQPAPVAPDPVAFGLGFELSIIMPLSWFPLIADYTSMAKSRRAAWLAPFLGYFVGSVWMYSIGMFGALSAGTADPSSIMLAARLGLMALLVIGFSTVTTTFLDVYSASVSTLNIFPRLPRRGLAVGFAALGTALAMVVPITRYVDFLHLLGSVFAPLVAIVLFDYFILRTDRRERPADWPAMFSLACGTVFYHWVKALEFPLGPTTATLIFALVLHAAVRVTTGKHAGREADLPSGTRSVQ